MPEAKIPRALLWLNPLPLLTANVALILLFPIAICLLEQQAGYVSIQALASGHSHLQSMVAEATFWIVALVSWPISLAALFRTCGLGCRAATDRPLANWWFRIALLEAAAWLVLWVSFAIAFFPAIACGLR